MRHGQTRWLAGAVLAALAHASAWADVAFVSSPSLVRFEYKRAVPLRLDLTRIAVRAAEAPEPDAEALMPGWWLVPTPGVTSLAQMRSLVAARTADAAAAFTSPVFLDDEGGPMALTPDILVRMAGGSTAMLSAQTLPPGAVVERSWSHLGSMRTIKTGLRNGFSVLSWANALAVRSDVRLAEPDMIFTGEQDFVPNDPLFINSWHQRNTGQQGGTPGQDMDAALAWDWTFGRGRTTIVIIDCGIELDHPEFAIRPDLDEDPLPGADFTDEQTGGRPADFCDRHGTAVAGVTSARAHNAIGLSGIAPGCRLASARAMITPCGGLFVTTSSWTIDALNWAVQIGARVTNNSNSYRFYSVAINDAYALTRAQGVVHFASAGNNARFWANYPASLDSVMGVAATDRFGLRASFSNYGYYVDLAAPGKQIVTTDLVGPDGYSSNEYLAADGTSAASANAAGVAALVLSLYPSLSAARVEQILRESAEYVGDQMGAGQVNARRALMAACPPDYDRDGANTVNDLNAFLTAYFAASPVLGPQGYAVYPCGVAGLFSGPSTGYRADFTGDCVIDQEDLSGFISAWMFGCQGVSESGVVGPRGPSRTP